MERTFILKIDTKQDDLQLVLDNHLSQIADEAQAGIQIYELSDKGAKDANKIIYGL